MCITESAGRGRKWGEVGSDIDLYHFQPFLERWNKILVLLYGSWLQDRRVVLALLQGDGVATILVVTVRRRGGEF